MIEATADTGARPRDVAAGAARAAGHARAPRRGDPRRTTRASRRSRIVPPTCRPSACPRPPASQMGALLRPIATPLVMSGMDAATSRSRDRRCSATPASRRCSSGGAGGDVAPRNRPAAPGRPDRRLAARRRRRNGRDRHRHPRRRRPHLRLRPSVLQLRPDRVSDDPRATCLRDAAQPDVVLQDRHDGRGRRDDAAGSRDGDCGHARARARR